MFVFIAGGGRTGAQLASQLIDQNYQVRLVEHRRELLGLLHHELPTEVIYEGIATDPNVLKLAGLDKANVIVACTNDDAVNLVLCYLARTMFKVKRTIARINNPRNAWLFDKSFHVDETINQADVMAHLIQEEMSLGDMMTLLKLRRGRYSVVEEKVPPGAKAVGVPLTEVETVISQLARTVFNGQGLLYTGAILGTTIILLLAANTAFAGFPRLSALMAKDGFLPRQLTYRGSRLVYSRGVVALSFLAVVLIVIFQASVTRLIPLYAIGVFLSFTISQYGMALRWWRSSKLAPGEEVMRRGSPLRFDPLWKVKMIINGFGALCTAVVMVVFAVTKFKDGAYIVLLLIPLMVAILWSIYLHYFKLAKQLSLENFGVIPPHTIRHRVIMPVSGVHQGTLAALRYARMLSDDVTAVHVTIEPADAEKVRQKWEKWGEGVRIVMLDSPYRLFIEPMLDYIADIAEQRQPGETITIVVPEFVSDNRLTSTLHTNTAEILRSQLKHKHDIVITNVPYHVHEHDSH